MVTRVGKDRHTFNVQTSDGDATVSADRIRKCPSPSDLPKGMKIAEPVQGNDDVGHYVLSEDPEYLDNLAELFVERIVSHRRDADGNMRLRLRWFGYASSEDTWEPVIHVPQEMFHRYACRKRLDPELFGVTSERNAQPSS
jgi:hypothetical protein